jgi:hypothetical protein
MLLRGLVPEHCRGSVGGRPSRAGARALTVVGARAAVAGRCEGPQRLSVRRGFAVGAMVLTIVGAKGLRCRCNRADGCRCEGHCRSLVQGRPSLSVQGPLRLSVRRGFAVGAMVLTVVGARRTAAGRCEGGRRGPVRGTLTVVGAKGLRCRCNRADGCRCEGTCRWWVGGCCASVRSLSSVGSRQDERYDCHNRRHDDRRSAQVANWHPPPLHRNQPQREQAVHEDRASV